MINVSKIQTKGQSRCAKYYYTGTMNTMINIATLDYHYLSSLIFTVNEITVSVRYAYLNAENDLLHINNVLSGEKKWIIEFVICGLNCF